MTELIEHCGLSGVAGGRLKGPMAKTVNGFLRELVTHRICSSAGDHGAVSVWRDDAGLWHGTFSAWRKVRVHDLFKTKAEMRDWLKVYLPRRHQPEEVLQ